VWLRHHRCTAAALGMRFEINYCATLTYLFQLVTKLEMVGNKRTLPLCTRLPPSRTGAA
jgi:hypothetical protein